ncbi:MAG: DUF3667 domain-containing protein [Calditrichaeota bacterium]|nr:DUF3667 domain-containing protein [Calditrichota bacterium]
MRKNNQQQTCVTCNSAFTGTYCPHCGEKVIDPQEYSLLYFLRNVLKVITHVDNRFWSTFYVLIRKPGWLSRDYLIGRRRPYLNPVQMFLIANFIYFFIQPLTNANGFNTPLITQIKKMPYSPLALSMVKEKIISRETTYDAYEAVYNQKSSTYARTLIFLMIPLLALVLKLLFWKHRRYFVEHLVFSLHFYIFLMVYILIVLIALLQFLVFLMPRVGLALSTPRPAMELAFSAVIYLALFIYFYRAFNTFYNGSRWLNGIRALFLPIFILLITQTYRLVLFLLTYYTT